MVVNMNLPLTPADRRSWGNILGEVIHPIAILGALAVKIQLGMIERENAVFTIDQICSTGLYYPRSLRKWLEGWTSRILIRFPRLALIVLRSVYRLIHFKPLMKDESFLYLLGREGVIVENGIPRARKPAPKVDKETGLSTEN